MNPSLKPLAAALLVVAGACLAPSCELINPPEQLPTYLRIDTIILEGNPGEQGFLSHNISEAWVVINNQLSLSAYQLPAVVPVLAEGPTTITINAGIRRNGLSNSREAYPLYEFYAVERTLQPFDTLQLNPVVRYQNDIVFSLLENFETGNNFAPTLESNASFEVINDPSLAFEGNRCARVLLEGTEYLEIRSGEKSLPDVGLAPVYLEMDYRCNQPFEVWVRSVPLFSGTPISSFIVSVAPKDDWNKIYVYLSEQLGQLDDAVYQISIQAIRDPGVEVGEIYLDNLKLLYR
ncbi:MAG: hypothetical protein GC205_12445 [Bacteroidetes bacterium]|nr:hypothetical protein [Bacteroidota bacterium]